MGRRDDTNGEGGRARRSRTRSNSSESKPSQLLGHHSAKNKPDVDMGRNDRGQQESLSAEAAGRARLGDRRYAQYRKQAGPAIDVDRLGNRRAAQLLAQRQASAGPLIRRKAANGGSPTPRAVKAAQRDTSQGSPLPAASAAKMGAAFGRNLSDVRVHRDASANQLSAGLRAQAFTRGNDVYFASGKYAPGTQEGDRLLAHEVAHTQQPSRGQSGLSRGGDQAEVEANRAAERVTSGAQVTPMVAERPGLSREDEPAPLADRVAAFKRMVLATARLRVQRNRTNLQMWANLVAQMQFGAPGSRLRTGYQVAHLGTIAQQRGRQWSYERYLRTRNPAMQVVRQHQAEGEWLACTGCHMEVRASDWGRSQPDNVRDSWRSPSEVVRGVHRPLVIENSRDLLTQTGSLSSYLASLNAPTQQVARQPTPPPSAPLTAPGMTETERVQPYLQRLTPIVNALGENGYKVLSGTSFFWRSDVSSEQIREWILDGIRHRRSQYQELIASIDAGDREYLEFHPIVSELLPLQAEDVRAVIQEEIDDEEFWDQVAFWFTLGISAVLILAAILTPFAVFLGPTVLGTMEAGLGAYMVMHGLDTYDQGRAYGQSEGTTGIYSPEQQSNAGFMQFMGVFSVAAGGLSGVFGGARLASGLRTAETTALARLPQGQQTLQSGPVSVIIDGERAVGTVAGRPDLLLIKEGSRISMYQRAASGELVLLRTGTLGETTAAASTSTELATVGPQMAPPQLMAPPAPFGYLPAPVRGPTVYQLPLAGGRGVMNMERGLVPTDLGLNTMANQPELLEIWQEAMALRGVSRRGNAYTRYLDAYEAGTLRAGDPVSTDLAADAFSYVQEKFLPLARARGHDVATVHHWNFSKGQYPHQVLDPRNLVPVRGQSALRGGSHPVHTSVHRLTTSNPENIFLGPVGPVHVIPLEPLPFGYYPRSQ